MRFFAIVSMGAALAAAAPQVYSISQISDGQIQAPPATAPAATGTPVVPTVPAGVSTPVVATSQVVPPMSSAAPVVTLPYSSVPVVVPIPTGMSSGAPVVSSAGVFPNSTVAVTHASSSPVATAPGSPSSPSAPAATGGAVVNMASFGALALAAAGFVLA